MGKAVDWWSNKTKRAQSESANRRQRRWFREIIAIGIWHYYAEMEKNR